jgi:hypothetical protein
MLDVMPPLLDGICHLGNGPKRHQGPPAVSTPPRQATIPRLRPGALSTETARCLSASATPDSERSGTPHQSTVAVMAPAANCG